MKLSALTGARREAKVVFKQDGEEDLILNVVWNPMNYTAAFEEGVADMAEEHPSGALAMAATGLLIEWDLEDADGNTIPITDEAMKDVPIGILAQIFKQIRELAQPRSEEGKDSAAGSQQAATSESSLSGTH